MKKKKLISQIAQYKKLVHQAMLVNQKWLEFSAKVAAENERLRAKLRAKEQGEDSIDSIKYLFTGIDFAKYTKPASACTCAAPPCRCAPPKTATEQPNLINAMKMFFLERTEEAECDPQHFRPFYKAFIAWAAASGLSYNLSETNFIAIAKRDCGVTTELRLNGASRFHNIRLTALEAEGTKEVDAIELIANERRRQIQVEGYVPTRDDMYVLGELKNAAECYLRWAGCQTTPASPQDWPWDRSTFKPTGDAIRDMTKAGALIAAEIDRLLRMRAQDDADAQEQKFIEELGSGALIEESVNRATEESNPPVAAQINLLKEKGREATVPAIDESNFQEMKAREAIQEAAKS